MMTTNKKRREITEESASVCLLLPTALALCRIFVHHTATEFFKKIGSANVGVCGTPVQGVSGGFFSGT